MVILNQMCILSLVLILLLLQVFFQLRTKRGRQSQLPLQAVGGARSERRPHIQPYSAAQPSRVHTKHHHWQVQPPVLSALRGPMWPARIERAGILLRCLFCFWKCPGTVPCLSNDICNPKVASSSLLVPHVSSHCLYHWVAQLNNCWLLKSP